ncbi:MAG TPA: type II toxin-antitoxin system VapC family toxin [Burkholderiaceae bacterium]|nr:type II toxin-antitoxin system VapC family toxin [Burkholderiaceae bacterium]
MNLLLDTHIALWAIADDRRLPREAAGWIADEANSIWVSAVSVWEIAIKHMLAKRSMPISGRQALGYFRQAGYRMLDMRPEHAAAIEDLPAVHADPFDRMLVAQARVEPLNLLTSDALLVKYGKNVLAV